MQTFVQLLARLQVPNPVQSQKGLLNRPLTVFQFCSTSISFLYLLPRPIIQILLASGN